MHLSIGEIPTGSKDLPKLLRDSTREEKDLQPRNLLEHAVNRGWDQIVKRNSMGWVQTKRNLLHIALEQGTQEEKSWNS